MNKVRMNVFLIVGLFFLFTPIILLAAPTEESLIVAWEDFQKNDSKTLIFKRLSSDRYRFKTDRFPFDGKLRVLNITVDEQMSGFEGSFIIGIVEVELLDLPEDFLEKYSYSYSAWVQSNILYYDKEDEEWLSVKEYYSKAKERIPSGFLMDILDYLPFLFLFFIVVIFIIVFNVQKKNKKYLDFARDLSLKETEFVERTYKLAKKSNKLLSEILKELKKKRK